MFLQVCVILFTGGWVPDQVHPQDQVHPPGPGTPPPPGPGTHPPQDQAHPPGPGVLPLDQVHPPGHSMLGDMVYARAVRILLECNLVLIRCLTWLTNFVTPILSNVWHLLNKSLYVAHICVSNSVNFDFQSPAFNISRNAPLNTEQWWLKDASIAYSYTIHYYIMPLVHNIKYYIQLYFNFMYNMEYFPWPCYPWELIASISI